MDLAMVEGLDNGNDVNCVNTTGTGTSKDGYQYMLFKTERPGIQREAPIRKRNLLWRLLAQLNKIVDLFVYFSSFFYRLVLHLNRFCYKYNLFGYIISKLVRIWKFGFDLYISNYVVEMIHF